MSDVILCGVGGQGTVLAAKLIARAAMNAELPVTCAETIGMAQRGGSVFSHVRLDRADASPLIAHGFADLIIGLEPAETVRQLSFLRADGSVVVSARPVIPVSATVGGPPYNLPEIMAYLQDNVAQLVVVDIDAALRKLANPKVQNVVLLGAAAQTGALGVTLDELRKAIHEIVPKRFIDVNLRALEFGASL